MTRVSKSHRMLARIAQEVVWRFDPVAGNREDVFAEAFARELGPVKRGYQTKDSKTVYPSPSMFATDPVLILRAPKGKRQ